MSNVPVRNKINGSKTSRVNVIQRTTSETLRLTDINCNNKGRTIAMSNQQPRKKPTGSFQVTGVSVISGDAGDDSTDDLDESRTDEASFSDDTVSRETDEAHQTQTLSTFPSSISVPSPIVSSNTSVATTSSTETAEAPSVSASPSKHFSDRFKVVKVESMVPFCRGRWTCMDYLDHSVHTPKDAYVYCQHQQQYVKASSVQMCDQSLQTPSVPSICQDPSTSVSSCSILQQSVSQQIPAQALPLQQNNEMLLIVQDNRQNSDSVAQTPIQTRVQMRDVQQPIEMVVLKEEQVSADIAVTHLQQNLVAQNVYQQINPGNVYTPCTYPAYQSLPAFYNQPCQGVFPQMDFHPTSFQCDLPWLIYSGMNSPIGVRYVPPPTPQIPQSLTFFTPMPDEYATTYQRTSQNSVPPLENDQSAAKNRPLKTERKAETITAPFTTRENYMSVATTLPAQAQSMGHTYSVTGMIDNGDKENPITPPQQIVSNAQPAKPQVTETPACRPTNVTSTSNNNDIGVPPTQTNKTCVAEANANNNATAASYQITKSSVSSDDTESVSAGSAVAIDNKIAQAMDLVKSHLMYAVREEVDVLKERISELLDRINQLEVENSFLRANVPAEVLSALNDRPDESQDGEGPKKSSPPNNTQGGSN